VPHSPRERQRFVRHLMSLGFEGDAVTAALAALNSRDDEGEIIPTGDSC
jgi:hypothetical protein